MGGFTYFKANKTSQIDFLLSDNQGRKAIMDFKIVTSGWHFSDHTPIDLTIRSKYEINSLCLLIRSRLINEDTSPQRPNNVLKFHNKNFDFNVAKSILTNKFQDISRQCYSCHSADSIVHILHLETEKIIKLSQIRHCRNNNFIDLNREILECDNVFQNYLYT